LLLKRGELLLLNFAYHLVSTKTQRTDLCKGPNCI